MTTPIVTAPCEVCGAEPAAMSMMNLADYSAIKVGNSCMPAFLASLATDLVTAGQPDGGHSGYLETCPACSEIHRLGTDMAAAAAPDAPPDTGAAGGPADDAAGAGDAVGAAAAGGDPGPDTIGAADPPPAAAAADPPRPGPVREPPPADTASDRERVSDVQRELLALAGITGPDQAPCPADGTVCWTAPGAASYVCPWCGGRFHTAPAAGMMPLVIDGTDGTRGDAAPAAAELSDNPAAAGVTPAI